MFVDIKQHAEEAARLRAKARACREEARTFGPDNKALMLRIAEVYEAIAVNYEKEATS